MSSKACKLTAAEATEYAEAMAALKPFGLTVETFVTMFVALRNQLPPGVTLTEVAAESQAAPAT